MNRFEQDQRNKRKKRHDDKVLKRLSKDIVTLCVRLKKKEDEEVTKITHWTRRQTPEGAIRLAGHLYDHAETSLQQWIDEATDRVKELMDKQYYLGKALEVVEELK